MREKLQTLSLVVLREFAKDKKIKGITAMRKAELIDAIIEASGGEEAQAEASEKQNTEAQSHKDRKNTRRFKVRQHRQHVPEEVKKHRVTQETIMHREAMSVRIMKNAVNTATMKADRIIKTTERNTGMTVRTTEVI